MPKILVVDPDPDSRTQLRGWLEEDGYEVVEVPDASQALRKVRQGLPGLMVVDLGLASGDGMEALREIHRLQPGLRVLALVPEGEAPDAERCKALGVQEFLPRPLEQGQVAGGVRRLLQRTGPNILVLDDEPAIRKLVNLTLAGAGYSVFEAGDGRRALKICEEAHIDLVITDLIMPDSDGIETIRSVRERFPGIQVIAISGDGYARGYLDGAKRFGAAYTFAKPFDLNELLAAVQKLLGSVSKSS